MHLDFASFTCFSDKLSLLLSPRGKYKDYIELMSSKEDCITIQEINSPERKKKYRKNMFTIGY